MTEAADDDADRLAVALFSEMLTADQLVRARLTRALPKGMELSHFIVLNHLAQTPVERSPTELARTFHLTRGAVTNTLAKLEWAGHIHVRPDWDDARRKRVAISPSGIAAREAALAAIRPIMAQAVREIGEGRTRAAIPVLREIRQRFGAPDVE
ncbi:MAG: MarR family transcriptional regulator [Jannaschia helgolandensis]|jgi:DNA-binding MarR family transcriptional regulator|uniref:Transcriptional regulator, MarR family n=1 Tax=Jannaschia helgolandensis TaxID=188906 RepID=A0A1H7GGK2_9RHOB|nr:MarR family transcriptional regulator [Jannaschia helgolandensis]SEK37239.1 transcriptional regulator, MarR family [Jannaschia helgolandensis]|tara:strand:+ start:1811 stop:2272 length:462 start_codon:yes stop_codon:yes gene_type:complete